MNTFLAGRDTDIRTGYRPDLGSMFECVKTVFGYFHNETGRSNFVFHHRILSGHSRHYLKTKHHNLRITSISYLVNIHSHLWGAAVFFVMIMSLTSPSGFTPMAWSTWMKGTYMPSTVTWHDTAVFGCFYLSGMACLGFSATYHTVTCHSESVE